MAIMSMSSRAFLRRRLKILIPLAISLYFLLTYFNTTRTTPVKKLVKDDPQACDGYEELSDILIVLKTGATEAKERLPIHFETTLRCAPNYVIYSDLAETIDGYEIHDALDDVSDHVKWNKEGYKEEWKLYERMKKIGRKAIESHELNTGNTGASWKLDKWKFMPMLQKALRYNPDVKWYLFLECDTYIFFSNLLQWLHFIDPNKGYYIGSQMQIAEVIFAHGGSGYLISAAAAKLAAARHKEDLHRYEGITDFHWAGDAVLGRVMMDVGLNVRWVWPLLQTRALWDMDPNEFNWGKRLWCFPSVSYHHMSPREIALLWEYELEQRKKGFWPIRHRHVFTDVVYPNITSQLSNWETAFDAPDPHLAVKQKKSEYTEDDADNADFTEAEKKAWKSVDDCRELCTEQPKCMQFRWEPGKCIPAYAFSLGRPRHAKSKGHPDGVNGWMVERVKDQADSQAPCGEEGWLW